MKLDTKFEIGKELLSIIEELDVTRICTIKEDYLYYKTTDLLNEELEDIATFSINIHELAHKCKEWAIKQDYGYIINSCTKHTFGYAQVEWYEKNHKDKHGTYREHTFYSEWFKAGNNSEPEAIFKACEWILKEKDEV